MAGEGPGDLAARVQRLEDIHAATDILYEYGRRFDVDEPDPDFVAELFAEDAVLTSPIGEYRGRERIADFVRAVAALDPTKKTHLFPNVRCTWMGPGSVRLQAAMLVLGRGVHRSAIAWGGNVLDARVVDGHASIGSLTIINDVATDLATGWPRDVGR